MAVRKYIHITENGASTPKVLDKLMQDASDAIVKGTGRFTLTIDDEQLGQDQNRQDILYMLHRRLDIGVIGPTYRVRDPAAAVFTAREIAMAPDIIDTSGNDKADAYWTGLKDAFPNVTFLGSYVCKPDSQHRFGNAVDGGFSSIKMGEDMFKWAVSNHAKYDLRNLIVQKKIWHLGTIAVYTGVPHVTHTHADFDPTFDTSLPCGVRP